MKKSFKIEFIKLTKPVPAIIVQLSGPLDTISVDQFVQQVNSFIQGGYKHIVLSCGDLNYINSTGIKEVMNIYQTVTEDGGYLCLVSVNQSIYEILNLVGVNQVLPIFETNHEVLAELQKRTV